MSKDWEFTEDEIRDKLAELGYMNIPREKLREFADGECSWFANYCRLFIFCLLVIVFAKPSFF
jgi:hypothetical protein